MDRRIIPARAGFTWGRCGVAWGPLDHPRSRGVYRSHKRSICPPAGSSPLARGLLVMEIALDSMRRIIPARAGFTSS